LTTVAVDVDILTDPIEIVDVVPVSPFNPIGPGEVLVERMRKLLFIFVNAERNVSPSPALALDPVLIYTKGIL
jgi:hypothetical protein